MTNEQCITCWFKSQKCDFTPDTDANIPIQTELNNTQIYMILWRSKIWASDLGPGTTFHQQYARGEEITVDRCN